MRKVYIQKENGEFVNENAYVAYYGFDKLAYDIEFYEGKPPEGLMRSDIVVGWIGSVKHGLKNLGITPPGEIDYPQDLMPYFDRKIWKSTLSQITEKDYPVFIKPQIGKYFNGKLVTEFKDMIGFKFDEHGHSDIWCSEPVNFLVEYRVFVRYGQILGARKYKGNPFLAVDEDTVKKAIEDYKDIPAGCSMDFGLTDDGRTLLVEVNAGYALGSYGLFPTLYASLIAATWHEMTDTIDPLQTI
jgi:hypothetical protein